MSNCPRCDGKRNAYAGAMYTDALANCPWVYPPHRADYIEGFLAEVAILDMVAKEQAEEEEEQADFELNMLMGGLDECGFTDDQVAALRTVFGRLLER